MRTLATQVKLRRLIRAFGESCDRLGSEPLDRRVAGSIADRLLELAEAVRASWLAESLARPPGAALDRHVDGELRAIGLAITGLQQDGADVELLRRDFEVAALPLEIFLRGLDVEPALQRSA